MGFAVLHASPGTGSNRATTFLHTPFHGVGPSRSDVVGASPNLLDSLQEYRPAFACGAGGSRPDGVVGKGGAQRNLVSLPRQAFSYIRPLRGIRGRQSHSPRSIDLGFPRTILDRGAEQKRVKSSICVGKCQEKRARTNQRNAVCIWRSGGNRNTTNLFSLFFSLSSECIFNSGNCVRHWRVRRLKYPQSQNAAEETVDSQRKLCFFWSCFVTLDETRRDFGNEANDYPLAPIRILGKQPGNCARHPCSCR